MAVSRLFKYGIGFLVYTNLFIAVCAMAYTARTSQLLYGNNGHWQVNMFVFFATLLFYCFHRMNKKNHLTPDENLEERNSWMDSHKGFYYFLIGTSLVALLVELFLLPVRTWPIFIPVALLGVGYTFSVIPTRNGWKRLRDIYWLKTVWIAFAFSWLTTFLPVIYTESYSTLLKPEVLFIFCRSFLFLFAICIPFDIRDMKFDKTRGVNTLPVITGAETSIYIAVTLLLIFISLICVQFLYFNLSFLPAAALFTSAITTICLLFPAKKKRPALFYPLLFDGVMTVQWLLVFFFTHPTYF